jgi:carboxymethylenebutenolidase
VLIMLIHTEAPVLSTDGMRSFDSYLARPPAGVGPGLIILTEMWGITALNRDMADAFARQGWCALVPNMFWHSELTGVLAYEEPERSRAWARLRAFDFDRAADDVRTAAGWLRASRSCSGKIAAIGFCMGGRTAFLAASRAGIDAAAALYALGIAQHLDEIATVPCPLQLHYGLNDQHIPRSEIDAVSRAAQDNRNITIHLYPGAGHGFFNPARATYDPQAVELASERIGDMLASLKAES